MYNKSGPDQSADLDESNMDKGSKSKDMDQSQNNLFDVFPPMP